MKLLPYPNIVVTTGKEAVVNANLIESFNQLDAVILTPETNKDRSINKLATVSAQDNLALKKSIGFLGGRSDVGRLAANFRRRLSTR